MWEAYRKNKKHLYGKEKKINDRKLFLKTARHFLPDKMVSKGKITVVKKDYIIPNINKSCKILNLLPNTSNICKSFRNATKNQVSKEYSTFDLLIRININNPKKHPRY